MDMSELRDLVGALVGSVVDVDDRSLASTSTGGFFFCSLVSEMFHCRPNSLSGGQTQYTGLSAQPQQPQPQTLCSGQAARSTTTASAAAAAGSIQAPARLTRRSAATLKPVTPGQQPKPPPPPPAKPPRARGSEAVFCTDCPFCSATGMMHHRQQPISVFLVAHHDDDGALLCCVFHRMVDVDVTRQDVAIYSGHSCMYA